MESTEQLIKVGVVYNAFDPTDIKESTLLVQDGLTLADYLVDLPTECEWRVGYNGVSIEPTDYNEIVPKADDIISLVVIPEGGGAKDILRMIALVAVMVVAAYLFAPMMVGGLALAGPGMWGMAAFAGAMMVGSLLVNLLLPPAGMEQPESDGQNYGYDGAKNTAREGVAIPVVYGTYRVAGNYVDLYTKNVGDNQYLYGRCVLSDGEIDNVTDVEINEQPIDSFRGVSYFHNKGTYTEPENYLFGRSVAAQNAQFKLTNASTIYQFTTTTDVDALEINLVFPSGLVKYNKKGKKRRWSVPVEIKYRLQGATTWTTTNITYSDIRQKTIRKTWSTPTLTRGTYEIEVRRTTAPQPEEGDDNTYIEELFVSEINEIQNSNVALRSIATGWYSVKMSDQLSNIPNVTWKVKGVKVNKYDINGNIVAYEHSANPAWITLDMLIGERRGAFPNAAAVDYPAFVEWAEHCEANALFFNGIFEETQSLWDALTSVMRVGRATLTRMGTKLSVAVDKPAAPVMLFGNGNIIKDTFQVSYMALNDRANEFEFSYYDEADRNKQKSIRIIDPAAEARGEIPRPTSYSIKGITSFEQAKKEVWYQLYTNRLQKRVITFDAPIESIGLTIGDVAYIQHDMVDWAVSGRVERVVSYDVATLTARLQLDKDVAGAGGDAFLIIHADDEIDEGTYTDLGDGLIEVVGIVKTPTQYSNYMIGETAFVKKPFRLRSINGDDLYRRTLTFIEYNDFIYSAPEQEIPLPTIKEPKITRQVENISWATDPIVNGDGTLTRSVGWTSGHIHNYGGADIYVSEKGPEEVEAAELHFYRTVMNVNQAEIEFQTGNIYEIKVVPFSQSGIRATYNDAPTILWTADESIPTFLAAPIVLGDGTAIDHTIDSDGKARVSFNWSFDGNFDAIDGFVITAYSSSTNSKAGAWPQYFKVPKGINSVIFTGASSERYYWLSVKSYRNVPLVNSPDSIAYSVDVASSLPAEAPYRPFDNTPYAGAIEASVTGELHYEIMDKDGLNPAATRNVNRGVWVAGTDYVVGDVFYNDAKMYEVLTMHTSDAAFPPPNANVQLVYEVPQDYLNGDRIAGYLTNQAHTVPASFEGNVTAGNLAEAGGDFKVFQGDDELTNGITFEVVSATSGLTIGIDAFTGVYTITGLTADSGSAILKATYGTSSVEQTYSISKSKAGSIGEDAKTLKVTTDKFTIAYNADGSLKSTDINAAVALTTTVQGLSVGATYAWTMKDWTGATIALPENYLSSITATSVTLPEHEFDIARGATEGVVVTCTVNDGDITLSDSVSIMKVEEGAPGADGIVGYLTNPTQQLHVDGAGNILEGATIKGGGFPVIWGNDVVTSNVAYSIVTGSQVGGTFSINATTGAYEILTLTAATASVTFRAIFSGVTPAVTVDRKFECYRIDGSENIYIRHAASNTIKYNSLGVLEPATQTISFGAVSTMNLKAANYTWTLARVNADGTETALNWSTAPAKAYTENVSPTSASTQEGYLTLDPTKVNELLGSGVAIKATVSAIYDGNTYTDNSFAYKVRDGETGAKGDTGDAAKLVTLNATNQTFAFDKDGVPKIQTATYAATKQGSVASIVWQINKLDGTQIYLNTKANIAATSYFGSGTGDSLTQTQTQFADFLVAQNITGFRVRALLSGDAATYDEVSIIKIQDGAKGDSAPLTQLQFSPDNSTWSSGYSAGDKYWRQSVDGGSTWSTGERLSAASLAELDADAANQLDAATASLAVAADDSMFSAAEKYSTVLPKTYSLFSKYRTLLMEGSSLGLKATSENILKRSNEFDQWGTGGTVIVTANNAKDPLGNMTADTIAEDTGTGGKILTAPLAPYATAGKTYTDWLVVKAGTLRYLQIAVNGSVSGAYVNFDLKEGKITLEGNGGVGYIEPWSEGYYLIAMTWYCPLTSSDCPMHPVLINSPTQNRGGGHQGSSRTIYFYHAQRNEGTKPKPLITTTTNAITQTGVPIASPQAISNGGFDSANNWVLTPKWTISGGVATASGETADFIKQPSAVIRPLKMYTVTYTCTAANPAPALFFYLNGVTIGNQYGSQVGTTYTITGVSGADTSRGFEIYASANGTVSIDNVSVREVASQADYAVEAYSNYLDTLQNAIPAWDDQTVDSKLIPADNTFVTNPDDLSHADWTKSNATVSRNGTYWTLLDDGATSYEYLGRSASVTGGKATVIARVKKDAVPKTTRFTLLRLRANDGSTLRYSDLNFDTSTGESLVVNTSGGLNIDGGVFDNGDEWLCWAYGEFNAESAICDMQLFPAVGANSSLGAITSAATGSIDVRGIQLLAGSIADLARTSYQTRLAAFSDALDTLETEIAVRGSLSGYLTNESHMVPADKDGNVLGFTGADGNFKVFLGTTDITSQCTFATTATSETLLGVGGGTNTIINTTTGAYALTGGMNADTIWADLTATHTATGQTVTKRFTVSKSKTGATGNPGTDGVVVRMNATANTFEYDGFNNPKSRTITFTAAKQGTTAGIVWRVYTHTNGTMHHTATKQSLEDTGYFGWDGVSEAFTMTETQFANFLTAYGGTSMRIRAHLNGNEAIYDEVTVTKVQDGTRGIGITPVISDKIQQDGNVFTKTSTSAWDAGVYSQEGYVGAVASWKFGSTTHSAMGGLSKDPTINNSYTSMTHAIYAHGVEGTIRCYENGSSLGVLVSAGAWSPNDVFSVAHMGDRVEYRRNGSVMRTTFTTADGSTSGFSAGGPVSINDKYYFDSSLNSVGASIKDITIGTVNDGTDPWGFVLNGVSRFGNRFFRNTSSTGWVASAHSTVGGVGAKLSVKVVRTDSDVMFGLNDTPASSGSYTDMNHAVYLPAGSAASVRSGDGSYLANIGAYAVGDIFTLEHIGSEVVVKQNGVVKYRYTGVSPSAVYYADTSWASANGALEEVTFSVGAVAALTGYLTNEAHVVPADSSGTVTSYAQSNGQFKVMLNDSDVTANCTFSVVSNPQTLTNAGTSLLISSSSGNYNVDGGLDAAENLATVTFRATYTPTGATIDKTFTLTKSKQGPTGGTGPAGRDAIVFNQSTTPTGAIAGDTWYNTSTKVWSRYSGSAWVQLLGTVSSLDTISANNISVTSIAAINSNLGTFTSGTSTTGMTIISGPLIEVRDTNNVVRVRLGKW